MTTTVPDSIPVSCQGTSEEFEDPIPVSRQGVSVDDYILRTRFLYLSRARLKNLKIRFLYPARARLHEEFRDSTPVSIQGTSVRNLLKF